MDSDRGAAETVREYAALWEINRCDLGKGERQERRPAERSNGAVVAAR
jgi:hypothetical protein